MWRWDYAQEILPMLLRALVVTIEVTFCGMAVALIVGLVLALLRRSHRAWLSWPVSACIEFVRSTPLLVQIYFLFYAIIPQAGFNADPFVVGVVALGLHYGAYTSEVYRSGIDGVPRGQWEAATALNFSRTHLWLHVILPQAIPPIVPALGNRFIAMFKDTPLLSAITLMELLQTAKIMGSESFRYVEPFTLVGVLFLAVSLPCAAGVRQLERWMQIRHA